MYISKPSDIYETPSDPFENRIQSLKTLSNL